MIGMSQISSTNNSTNSNINPNPNINPSQPLRPRVLSIAGTDPTGGAGAQADLKSIMAAGGYGMSVILSLIHI